MHTLWRDCRFAGRQLSRSLGFTLTTVLTLALGIGATTAIFSLVHAVLLEPLPFPHAGDLMSVQQQDHATAANLPENVSYPTFFDWRARSKAFSGLSSYYTQPMSLTGMGDAQQITGAVVSANFLGVLGVRPLLGRDFLPQEEKAGSRSVLLSYSLWQTEFSAAKDVVGHSMRLNGDLYQIIGVMPRDFSFPITSPNPLFWTTLAVDTVGQTPATTQRGFDHLSVIGRLKPGVSVTQAHNEMNLVAQHLAREYPDTSANFTTTIVQPELDHLIGDYRPALRVLFTAVISLLLIACVNVAGLLLARTSQRRGEIAVRAALGASRVEITRQVLVESVLLALGGGAAGVLLAQALLKAMLQLAPEHLPRSGQVSIDGFVLVFALVTALATGLLFGFLPAWRASKADPSLALRSGTRAVTGTPGEHRLQSGLVIAETAISLALLVGAGLLIHSFVRVLQVNPGFDAHNVLSARVGLSEKEYPTLKAIQFHQQLLDKLATLPGVQSVAAGSPLPLSGSDIDITFTIEGRPAAPGHEPDSHMSIVTPGFFRTLHIPMVSGRDFARTDAPNGRPVIILNQAFVRKYFPGENPIGKHIKPGLSDDVTPSSMREVIGVVGDTKVQGLTAEAAPQYYLPYAQAAVTNPYLCIRTTTDPASLIGPLRDVVQGMDRNVPLYRISTAENYVSLASAQPRFQAMLLGCFAGLALLIAAIGLYAVLTYMVTQRTLEIGLRMAMGAGRADVLAMILRRGLALSALGLAAGLCVALLLTRFIGSMLFEVQSFDPVTIVAVSLLLLLVAVVASLAPALRAANLDPYTTLRQQ